MKLRMLCLLFGLYAAQVQAMTLETVGSKIFATGAVGGNDFTQFKQAFENASVDTVVFVNSPGGDLWTGLIIGRMIAEKGYQTITVGSCMSACSIMFMGGRDRRFGDPLRPSLNVIGIHGPHDQNTKRVDPQSAPQIYSFYKQMMGERFKSTIINQALYDMEDAGAMLRIFETTRDSNEKMRHCKSAQMPRRLCTEYPAENGFSLGVLTTLELAKIELPASLKEVPMVLGQLLDKPIDAMPEYLNDVAKRACGVEVCRTNIRAWGERKENRALATRIAGTGVGVQFDAISPITGFVRSIYNCNHLRGSAVGLCHAEAVNRFDVRSIYVLSQEKHKEAWAQLKVPADAFYANEELGGGFTSAQGYRLQQMSAMTPQKLDGIATVGTQALAKALLGVRPPFVIDVWGGVNEVIPSSQALVNGGLAFENPTGEDAYHLRFVALLALLAPDKDHPIVFYSAGRESWQAANAAMRAKAAGYAQVQWYRGGYAAWKAASLPVALIAVKAVAN